MNDPVWIEFVTEYRDFRRGDRLEAYISEDGESAHWCGCVFPRVWKNISRTGTLMGQIWRKIPPLELLAEVAE